MINTGYLKYVAEDKQEEVYKSMLHDIYYFYYGVRLNENETITCLNGLIYDVSKENLKKIETNTLLC